jgi:hypothetical protein
MLQHPEFHPYAIYHATSPLAMLMPNPHDWQINRDRYYRHVANVYAPRDWVFSLTNHSEEQDWTARPEVFWVRPGSSPRSTSVGDVIYSPSTGQAWLVTADDVQEIPQSEVASGSHRAFRQGLKSQHWLQTEKRENRPHSEASHVE